MSFCEGFINQGGSFFLGKRGHFCFALGLHPLHLRQAFEAFAHLAKHAVSSLVIRRAPQAIYGPVFERRQGVPDGSRRQRFLFFFFFVVTLRCAVLVYGLRVWSRCARRLPPRAGVGRRFATVFALILVPALVQGLPWDITH